MSIVVYRFHSSAPPAVGVPTEKWIVRRIIFSCVYVIELLMNAALPGG
jgi:hypothetical protein